MSSSTIKFQNLNKTKYRGFLLISFLLISLLSGCMDISQEIWINADGGGQCRLQIAIPDALIKANGKDQYGEMVKRANSSDGNATTKVIASDEIKEGIHYYTYQYETSDIKNCLGQTFDKNISMQLVPIENGRTRYVQTLKIGEAAVTTGLRTAMEGSEAFPGLDSISSVIQSSMFKGHYWNVFLHVPGEVSYTNGQYDKTTNTIAWRVPLDEILGKNAQSIQLELEYLPPGEHLSVIDQLGGWIYPMIFVAGFTSGMIVLGIALGVIKLIKKRPASNAKLKIDANNME